MPFFTEPDEALDAVYNLLNDNKGALGLGFVGYSDERTLFVYPAAVVSFNIPTERTLHATHQFRLNWSVQVVVYHARMSASHKIRSREDMQLAIGVREKLHEDYTMGGGVIFGYVTSERPGIMVDERGQANIATMLIWEAESRAVFS
jgi:hypothetical protein